MAYSRAYPTGRRFLSSILSLALILGAGAGCTKQLKRARHLAKGNKEFNAERYDRAEIEYLNVLKSAPQDATAYGRLGLIYFAEGRMPWSHFYLHKAVELQPDNLETRLKLGLVQLAFGNLKEARTNAMFVLGKQPTNQEALIVLAES